MNFIKLQFMKLEKNVFLWIVTKWHRILIYSFVVLMLFILHQSSYINLFFNSYLFILTSVAVAPFVLKIDNKLFFWVGIALFAPVLFLWLIGQTENAQSWSEYIFVILLSGSLRIFLSSE